MKSLETNNDRVMTKRKLELDVSDISELTEESINSVAVHGRIVDISPVKTSKKDTRVKYIEGRLTDGKEVCRFVSFSPSKIKSEIDGALQLNSDESLKFENCSVKKSKIGTGYEIVMTQRSKVACSPKKFRVDDEFMKQKVDLHGVRESSLKDIVVGDKVTVNVKILSLKEIEEVTSSRSGKTLKKQDAVVADHSQACRLVLWEELPNSVQVSKSYKITGATVKFYNGEKFLSTTENSEITEIDDLKEVNENTIDVRKNEYFTAEIVGVISYKGFSSCISCASKVLDCCNGIGECSKCGLKVRMDKCKKSAAAKVIIEGTTKIGPDLTRRTVSMFGDVIRRLQSEVTEGDGEVMLLNVGQKSFHIINDTVVDFQNVDC